MRLLIIRHGESEADILNVHEGRADFDLTGKGQEQAEKMALFVAGRYHLDKIYCSTLKRAYQTASHLAHAAGLPLYPDEMLREFDNGLVAGLDRKTAQEKYPKVDNLPVHAAVYKMESQLQFRYRAEYMLSKIVSENRSDSTVAVVTHGGTIIQLYRAFLKLPVDAAVSVVTGDTGIHEWELSGDLRRIVYANRLGHLG